MLKRFSELTIRDAFMFAAVMADTKQCRRLLALILGKEILEVSVIAEKSMSYHPEYRGVRLDVVAQEAGGKRRFNVEMQVKAEKGIAKRSRYYHAQLDMDALLAGTDYEELPDTYVIFICDFDPFGKGCYRYTFENICEETKERLRDGNVTVFLSTKGKNREETPEALVHFLNYVGSSGRRPYEGEDSFVRTLDAQIAAIKRNREWEAKFMLLEEMMKEERAEGVKEGLREGIETGRREEQQSSILSILQLHGAVPEALQERISKEKDTEVLKSWVLLAAQTTSVEEFIQRISEQ